MDRSEAIDHLRRYFEARHREGLGPGLAVAFTDSTATFGEFHWGVADARTGRTVDERTRFQIGSISKTITAAGVLRLVERGEIDLHRPVGDILDWFEVGSGTRRVTVHHLLTHTSGLAFLIDTVPASRLAVWQLRDTELAFEPGARFQYSNMGYLVLGYVLAAIIGGSFEAAISRLVFEPLGMVDSVGRLPESPEPPMAMGHFRMSEGPWSPVAAVELTGGHAGIGCTAKDLSTFLRMLLNGGMSGREPFLSSESIRLMSTGLYDSGWPGYSYGYGLFTGVDDMMAGHRIIHHAGENPGFESAMIGDLDIGLGVVAMVNSWAIPWNDAAHALAVLQAARSGLDPPEPPARDEENLDDRPPVGDAPPRSLRPYVGRYLSHAPLLREHRVLVMSGRLHVWRPGFGAMPLTETGEHVFKVESSNEQIRFACFAEGRAQQSILGGGTYARVDD